MTANEESADEPKIIVDDDWKSQVEKEKEALSEQASKSKEPDVNMQELPPASFMVLLSTLATQAMAALGFIADPATGKPNVNRPMAKHFIDTLAMLQEKTKGNLTEEESAHLRDGLHQLRMTYVASADTPKAEESSEGSAKPSNIELP